MRKIITICTTNIIDYYDYLKFAQLMLKLLYFVFSVLAFIVHFYRLIIRSQLIASLELYVGADNFKSPKYECKFPHFAVIIRNMSAIS